MSRSVLVTGSAGHLGRALRSAFDAQGDRVIGVDNAFTPYQSRLQEIYCNLNDHTQWASSDVVFDKEYDVVVCNAKLRGWESHEFLARRATSCIVNISSVYGLVGNDPGMYIGTEVDPTPAWYAASKAAMIGLTRWQATNLAPVRANCVCPGGIFRGHSDEFVRRYSEKVPLKRMATEQDVVGLVLFLASDAAAYITGQVIAVDGGATCMM